VAIPDYTAFWVDADDRVAASDGVSRYGAYVRQAAAGRFAVCWDGTWDEEPDRIAGFAAAAWRTATGPVMVPGYVRFHPRIRATRVDRSEWDGSLTGVVELVIPWPQALAADRSWWGGAWWRDWPAESWAGRDAYLDPGGEDLTRHPYLMACATLAFPLPAATLPAPPGGPGDDLEGKALRAVAVLVAGLNRIVTPVIETLERH